ncbi:after-VIT domain-containing protein [Microcoleus anatoxicus]|uniref:After-VIT domain-containing protein n=3 Tax=Microcoleus TaxID=44471 RepID=A0ABU8YPT5_9CYAN
MIQISILGLCVKSVLERLNHLTMQPETISLSSEAEMVCEEIEEIAPSKARRTSPVEVVSATGLDEEAIDSLNEHLATLTVPPGTNGELVLEIVFDKMRASRIVVDADASTLADVELLKTIKKWLFSWRIPHSIGDTVRLTLRVRS